MLGINNFSLSLSQLFMSWTNKITTIMGRTIRSLFSCHIMDWVSDVCLCLSPQFLSLCVSVSCVCLLQKSPVKLHCGRLNDRLYYLFLAAACILFPLGPKEEFHSFLPYVLCLSGLSMRGGQERNSRVYHSIIRGGRIKAEVNLPVILIASKSMMALF